MTPLFGLRARFQRTATRTHGGCIGILVGANDRPGHRLQRPEELQHCGAWAELARTGRRHGPPQSHRSIVHRKLIGDWRRRDRVDQQHGQDQLQERQHLIKLALATLTTQNLVSIANNLISSKGEPASRSPQPWEPPSDLVVRLYRLSSSSPDDGHHRRSRLRSRRAWKRLDASAAFGCASRLPRLEPVEPLPCRHGRRQTGLGHTPSAPRAAASRRLLRSPRIKLNLGRRPRAFRSAADNLPSNDIQVLQWDP